MKLSWLKSSLEEREADGYCTAFKLIKTAASVRVLRTAICGGQRLVRKLQGVSRKNDAG